MKKTMRRDLCIDVSKSQIYRAKRKAKELISAIGRDGNNQMFPIAVAVVEAELKDSWNWFLTNLLQAIGPVEAHGWTFISDRQKGLVEVFDGLLPGVDHRFCVQHMYNNFKEQFKGKVFKDLLWEAATSYTVQDWEKSMQKIKDANVAAYEWLMKVPPRMWTRAYFRPDIKCDLLCNNMCEAWNRTILDARELPIIDLMEKIRRQGLLIGTLTLALPQPPATLTSLPCASHAPRPPPTEPRRPATAAATFLPLSPSLSPSLSFLLGLEPRPRLQRPPCTMPASPRPHRSVPVDRRRHRAPPHLSWPPAAP
uniref:MULE transposase domain-containing protein n=1 Tax=Ananas comosus var. bracteatus TaxID=296719 RepID=A0A6V7NVX0_ANACO|nr:unnamed protein product [Ananas comosus var. bracteatus]